MTITSPAIDVSIGAGDLYTAVVNGTWNAADIGDGAVYLQITDRSNSGTGSTFRLPEIQLAPANKTFSYSLPMGNTIALIERAGTFTVRACKDSKCSQPYENASTSIAYRVRIDQVNEWATLQGNAAHDGYVPMGLDPSKFEVLWQWKPALEPQFGETTLGLPVTEGFYVYFLATREGRADMFVQMGHLTSGSWRGAIWPDGTERIATNLAYASGTLYAGVSNADFGMLALNASNGVTKFTSNATTGARTSSPPTPHDGIIFSLEGFRSSATRLVAVDAADGSLRWAHTITQAAKGKPTANPAVDANRVYYHSSCCLEILDRQTGAQIVSIPNVASDPTYLESRFQPVMLGGRGNAIALTYAPVSSKRMLTSFSIANRTREWTSALDYSGYPAVANGVVYAMRAQDGKPALHALDEATGQVLWTWSPTEADAQTSIVGNVLATRNLVFVSTANTDAGTGRTWAIDTTTHLPVWSHPVPGFLAISTSRALYITPPDSGFSGVKLILVDLQP